MLILFVVVPETKLLIFFFTHLPNIQKQLLRAALELACYLQSWSQVKRNVIISNKHDRYELPYELSNNLGN